VIEDEKKKFSTRTGLELFADRRIRLPAASGPPFKLRWAFRVTRASMSPLAEAWLISPALHSYQRRAVCFNPLHSVVVDYNGKGMLCCQVAIGFGATVICRHRRP